MPRLLLASGSPRRRDLLAAAGVKFAVISPVVTESARRDFSMRELTLCNAVRKAYAVARTHPRDLVLAADTLVSLDGQAIGKPADLAEAFAILRRLSGRTHQVCTSVCLAKNGARESLCFSVISHVEFFPLDDAAIRSYLHRIDPLDKAGAYAAQNHRGETIRRIRGSFTNVVGLPMDETLAALERYFGFVRQQISSLLPSGSSKKNA